MAAEHHNSAEEAGADKQAAERNSVVVGADKLVVVVLERNKEVAQLAAHTHMVRVQAVVRVPPALASKHTPR
jgi:hypothetical protein